MANNNTSYACEGDDYFISAEKTGIKFHRMLNWKLWCCGIDINGETVRPCISDIKAINECPLKVTTH